MNKKLVVVLMVVLVGISAIVIAQSVGNDFDCQRGSFEFDISNKIPDQVIGICPIQGPIKVDFFVFDDTYNKQQRIFNYSFQLNFGGRCVQGLGVEREVTYSREGQQCAALKTDMTQVFNERFNQFNKSRQIRKKSGGRF